MGYPAISKMNIRFHALRNLSGTGGSMNGKSRQSERRTGVVKFFNLPRGYGFIRPDGEGPDVFVHITAVNRAGMAALETGMRLSFILEPAPGGRGVQAGELQLLDGMEVEPR